MIDITETLTELRGTLALTSEERSRMRAHLAAFTPHARPTALPSPYVAYFMRPAPVFAMALALVLVVSGAGLASANGALPGDALYSVKVHVNENLERALAMTPEAKAYIDVKHAEERLSEIELLAANGTVNDTVAVAAAAQVNASIDAASSTATALADTGDTAGADDIRTHIASALLAHADILDAQAADLSDGPQQALRALSVVAAATADNAAEEPDRSATSSAEVEHSDTALTVDDREASARARIDALTKAIADADTLPQETHDELMVELASIERGFADAAATRASGDTASASDAYRALERRAYRALSTLTFAQRVSEKTGKELVLSIEHDDEAAPVRMNAAMFAAAAPAATTTRSHRSERSLQFFLRERSESDRDKNESSDD